MSNRASTPDNSGGELGRDSDVLDVREAALLRPGCAPELHRKGRAERELAGENEDPEPGTLAKPRLRRLDPGTGSRSATRDRHFQKRCQAW